MNQDQGTQSPVGWHTSTYSLNTDGNCVEVGWHISSHSPSGGGSCVEAGPLFATPTRVAVRDSTQRGLGFLSFPAAEWHAFLRAATRGEL
ncbi:DUF397 domain-containing protein [Thermobifida halotolerans]|uniref:DUF397 domain-containing protein n=1 Tax=Thermobifida halotolerans TaxID=483545 RepID=A0A399G2Z5_9ACTN|nr:DUF397 domain-containing protein [Thermobifida halotolerans]UOE17777.1 DUF397 domain-containing protein [Thermobifida halotolerans]